MGLVEVSGIARFHRRMPFDPIASADNPESRSIFSFPSTSPLLNRNRLVPFYLPRSAPGCRDSLGPGQPTPLPIQIIGIRLNISRSGAGMPFALLGLRSELNGCALASDEICLN